MRTIDTRTEFLQGPQAKDFADLVSHPAFASGVRAALLQFVIQEPRGNTWEDSARSHHYLQGAKDFAAYILTFIDQDQKEPQQTTENLQWPTKQSLQRQQAQRQARKP